MTNTYFTFVVCIGVVNALQQPYEVGAVIAIYLMRKLRHGEVTIFV